MILVEKQMFFTKIKIELVVSFVQVRKGLGIIVRKENRNGRLSKMTVALL